MTASLPGRLLAEDAGFTPLFRAWLAGSAGVEPASGQWRRFLEAPAGGRGAAWADPRWREAWLDQQLAESPDEPARERCREAAARLARGEVEVVVTGQQPGFLGGPLYTLYKVATAIAAARARTAAGRPTLPLFWSGDDDDDAREAFAPLLWDPWRRAFLRAEPPPGAADRMVGAADAADWGRGEAGWLRERAGQGGLAADLAALWEAGIAAHATWGALQLRALRRLFAGSDLLTVSGRDPLLHAAAAPLYERIWARREELAETVRASGLALTEAGWHAQLGDGSLARLLNVEEEGRRLALPPDAAAMPPASRLRPGVALRSIVQDWLLRPAGVVVGPGELAYLLQLRPVSEALGVPRSPLLPRLFALVAPAGEAADLAAEEGRDKPDTPPDQDALSGEIARSATRELARALRESARIDPAVAERFAAREEAGLRRRLLPLLARERERRAAGPAAGEVPWVRPLGRRQERTLAAHWAAALWGDPLPAAALAAAAEHLESGARGQWHERILPVDSL